MKYLFLVNHGSGAEFMQVSLIREFAKQHNNDKVYISAVNKYFADSLAVELDNVESIDRGELYPLFTTIMQNKKAWTIFQPEVYQSPSFFLREDNFYDTYRELIGMKRLKNWDKNGTDTIPYISFVPDFIKKDAEEFVKEHPNFILFQRQGGINPVLSPQERKESIQKGENGLKRSYPIPDSEKLVEALVNKGYEVLQYCLPEEPHIKSTLYLQNEANQLFYYELTKFCKGVITIDSSLLHLSIKNAPWVICLWAQSACGDKDCRGFGYKKAHNLFCHDYKPVSPYFNGMPDTPVIDYPSVDEIMEEVEKCNSALKTAQENI